MVITTGTIVSYEQAVTISSLFPMSRAEVGISEVYTCELESPIREIYDRHLDEFLSMVDIACYLAPTYKEVYDKMLDLDIWLFEPVQNTETGKWTIAYGDIRYHMEFDYRRDILPCHLIDANILGLAMGVTYYVKSIF